MTSSASAVGRYLLYDELASGGMASVHLARLLGPAGFSRTVAVKRLHRHFARDPEFVAMFLDEARLAARIRHPNVVTTLDVVAQHGEVLLVMEYVHGESLSRLIRAETGKPVPAAIASTILREVLTGLHAAHEAKTERGEPLGIVHRDVSPQNILIGVDGVCRLLDFGVAKAAWRYQSTRDGQLKGKLAYMAPEQVGLGPLDRRTDVFAASIVLWELLTGRRLFDAPTPAASVARIVSGPIAPPSTLVPEVPRALDAIVLRGLERKIERRFGSAREMAQQLEELVASVSPRRIGDWVERSANERLSQVARRITEIESASSSASAPIAEQPRISDAARDPALAEAPTEVSASLNAEEARTVPSEALGEPKRRSRLAAVTLVLVVLGVFGGLLVALRRPVPGVEQDLQQPPARAAPHEPSDPSPVGQGSAPEPPLAAAPDSGSAEQPPAASATRLPTRRGDCQPPYFVDDRGIKRFKRGCF